ncbi:protein kinase family repeat protein [Leptolyngbya sp. Heron Island J]|uniref:pentapeptide repeat-containing protein n=1 Tax=Leptolyngbya sp. Heron Island J TaxID=1385935 RepID=UPI0003B9DDE8|nr:pentapeptide repeat-containing protein [Leptolyngbya sp. Heron Island J]ESA32160.1 protein kinase family repeat protein [Leptolyngbya sp. Heron Island J]
MKRIVMLAFSLSVILMPFKSLIAGEAEVAELKAKNSCPSCNLAGDTLAGLNLSGANLTYANLANANLSGASLINATLTGANFSSTDLRNTNLNGAICGETICPKNMFGGARVNANTTYPDGSKPN